MEPEAAKWLFPRRRFRLRDLVVVMNRNVLDAARVDVDLPAEDRAYHGGAFYVPAGEAGTPWTLPADLFLRGRFPKQKICRMPFILRSDARARFQPIQLYVSEFAVIGKLRRVEINVALHGIRISFFLEGFDHCNLRGNVIRSARKSYAIGFDIQFAYVLKEKIGIFLSHR